MNKVDERGRVVPLMPGASPSRAIEMVGKTGSAQVRVYSEGQHGGAITKERRIWSGSCATTRIFIAYRASVNDPQICHCQPALSSMAPCNGHPHVQMARDVLLFYPAARSPETARRLAGDQFRGSAAPPRVQGKADPVLPHAPEGGRLMALRAYAAAKRTLSLGRQVAGSELGPGAADLP